jgi:hypothetical protein
MMESLWFQVPILLGVGLTILVLAWELLALMLRFLLAADKPNAPLKFKVPYILDDFDERAGFAVAVIVSGLLGGSLLYFLQWAILLAPFEIGIGAVVTVLVFSIRFLFSTMYDHNDRIGNTERQLGVKDSKPEPITEAVRMSPRMVLNQDYNNGDITTDEYTRLWAGLK